ncbi:MAG: phenylacetate-CoA oxygenase subunit PaaJ [Bacteroidetes bacterium]|nr:phenylacetate-CoA oxygenase subunit PaaJ [Bacteroidota bacterium]
MVSPAHSKEELFQLLSEIPDPEIPVVSIREMGMLRDINILDDGYEVVITPTYTGCPAMSMIESDIKSTLQKHGISPVSVKLVYSPAWTTDWMSAEAKEKMRKYGIAPPMQSTCNKWSAVGKPVVISCPRCQSKHTHVISHFGSTACKALYFCESCKEPFEYFKCH